MLLSAIFVVLVCLMALVVVSDVTRYTIPNWLCACILACYPLMLSVTKLPVNWMEGLWGFALVLVVGLGIYALRLMGGGDVKLLIASSIWFGLNSLLFYFVMYTVMLGGALAVLLLVSRPAAEVLWKKCCGAKPVPRVLTQREPIPYGVAIAGAFVWMMWHGGASGLGLAPVIHWDILGL